MIYGIVNTVILESLVEDNNVLFDFF